MKNTITKMLLGILLFSVCEPFCSADQKMLDQLVGIKETENGSKLWPNRLSLLERDLVRWTRDCLNKEWSPSKEARYVFLPAKTKEDVDKAVLHYELGGNQDTMGHFVTITQLQWVFSVEILRPKEESGLLSLKDIETWARKVLQLSEQVEYKNVSNDKDKTNGELYLDLRDPKNSKAPAFTWEIRWWQDERRVGFYFLKAVKRNGEVSLLNDLAWDLDYNQDWFKKYIDFTLGPKFYEEKKE